MVKKPEPAPESGPTREAIDLLLERARNPEIHGLFQRANREYVYWDKFKQLTVPGVDPKTAWTALKLNRRTGARYVPIQSVDGLPFWYTLTDELQRSLMVIERQGGGWVGTTAREVSRDARRTYLLRQLMEEAIASSQIEGAATTRRAAKEMLRTGREPETRGERMILNNYRTIGRIRELSSQPLTPQLLLDLQASLTAGTLNDASEVGRFRNDADDDIVVGDTTGQVLYVPPPARMLPDQVQALCEWANHDADDEFVHPVLKAAMLHFWLAYLHPFCDGNGRTARALFYLHALRHGYWLLEYVSISRVILRRRAQYAKAFLYSEVDDNDLTYFLTFHVHAIEKALEEFWEYVEGKVQEDQALEVRVAKDGGFNHRQRALLSRALKDTATVFTIESHRASHNVAYATARSDLLGLAGRGYLIQVREGRAFAFVAAPDIRGRLEAT
jgi:Fic family protein